MFNLKLCFMGDFSADLTAGAGIGGTINSSLSNIRSFKEQEDFNSQNRLDQWNMYNDQKIWNDPVTRVQRLKAAGLSVGLAYGQGGSIGQVSGSFNQAGQAPQLKADDGRGIMQAAVALESIKNMKADRDLKEAQADSVRANTSLAYSQNFGRMRTEQSTIDKNDADIKRSSTLLPYDVDESRGRFNLTRAQAQRSDALLAPDLKAVQLKNDFQKMQNAAQLMLNAQMPEKLKNELELQQAQIQAAALAGKASKVRSDLDQMEKRLREKYGSSWNDNPLSRAFRIWSQNVLDLNFNNSN